MLPAGHVYDHENMVYYIQLGLYAVRSVDVSSKGKIQSCHSSCSDIINVWIVVNKYNYEILIDGGSRAQRERANHITLEPSPTWIVTLCQESEVLVIKDVSDGDELLAFIRFKDSFFARLLAQQIKMHQKTFFDINITIDGLDDAPPYTPEASRRTPADSVTNTPPQIAVRCDCLDGSQFSTATAKHANLAWDVILSAELLGGFKPDPKVYLGALHHLSEEPERCALVAAHIYDLRAAASHGMKTVYVPRPTEDAEEQKLVKAKSEGGEVDVVVAGLEKLADLVKAANLS